MGRGGTDTRRSGPRPVAIAWEILARVALGLRRQARGRMCITGYPHPSSPANPLGGHCGQACVPPLGTTVVRPVSPPWDYWGNHTKSPLGGHCGQACVPPLGLGTTWRPSNSRITKTKCRIGESTQPMSNPGHGVGPLFSGPPLPHHPWPSPSPWAPPSLGDEHALSDMCGAKARLHKIKPKNHE